MYVGHRVAPYFEDQISLATSGQMRRGITCQRRHQQSSFFVFGFSWKSACESIFTAYPAALSDWFFMFAVSRAAGWEQEESSQDQRLTNVFHARLSCHNICLI